ncbi:ATP-binding protein [Ferruginibacter paludis]|uniref:hybrid sensor histidine kinase/response regulator n=1 Tax=Ferruginibacter paludis TaxID=1310417 RepID=UPI0025B3FDB8|nr:ATP-binding protein [Ferruginibacter paludis]MDN3655311.1 ATP-binding protein [Ferruginibacter paludis]
MINKIKILHLEDNPEDAELIARELKKAEMGAEIVVVDNKSKFELALQNFTQDIILSDHSLGSFDSHQALSMVKQMGITVPFILITSAMSDEFAVNVMKQGAHDYIIKDRLQRLPSAIINSINKHHLEKEQQALQERLFFHIENTPLGFIEWDNRGFAKKWSTRAEEIFGWSEQEFIERQEERFSLVYSKDLSKVNALFDQMLSSNIVRNTFQIRNITKEGRVIWCEWFNSVLKDEEQNVKTIMSLVQDITEQKELELQKDNLLTMVSHELNTPLTTIKGYGQMAENMLQSKGDKETLHLIKRMETHVNSLTVLVKRLLDFNETKNGKLLYNKIFTDFNALVKDVVDDLQMTTSTHVIETNFDNTAIIFADKDKLCQVLTNLVSNAVKYSPQADRIVINTTLENDGVQLSVKDFGIGILLKDDNKIFEQFYRVSADQSTFPGMGIGLYICSEIIKGHGGKIWYTSNIGEGSTFYCWLPLNDQNVNTV